MTRKYEVVILTIILLGLAVFAGYIFIGSSSKTMAGQVNYSTDPEKLKTDFNKDKGKVRLVLLLSPT